MDNNILFHVYHYASLKIRCNLSLVNKYFHNIYKKHYENHENIESYISNRVEEITNKFNTLNNKTEKMNNTFKNKMEKMNNIRSKDERWIKQQIDYYTDNKFSDYNCITKFKIFHKLEICKYTNDRSLELKYIVGYSGGYTELDIYYRHIPSSFGKINNFIDSEILRKKIISRKLQFNRLYQYINEKSNKKVKFIMDCIADKFYFDKTRIVDKYNE